MGSNNDGNAHDDEDSYTSTTDTATKNARHQASDSVSVTVITRRPRAIVVLLGWMGAEVGQLEEYVRMYHDLKCSTIVATAPVLSIAVQKTSTLEQVALTACREAARLVRMAEMSEMGCGTVPLLLHAFGNGGALVLEQMDRLIREWVSEQDLEDVRQQAQVSPCPVPLRPSFKPMGSMKSLPSLTSTAGGSEEEYDMDTPSKDPILWTPPSRVRSSSSFSFSSSSPPLRNLSFDQCRLQEQNTFQRTHKSSKVRRHDVERSAAFSPTASHPKYNMEDRAYQRDFSLIASRLYLGTTIFDSAPSYPTLATDLSSVKKIDNYLLRMVAWSAVVGAHGVGVLSDQEEYTLSVGGELVKGRARQFWKNMEQLSLTKRHVYVHNSSDSTAQLSDLMCAQRDKGILVKECRIQETDPLYEYLELLENVLDSISKKTLEEDEDGWSSDEEEWHSARSMNIDPDD